MNNDELKHVGVLGMRWGHRTARESGAVFTKNRPERIKVANQLAAVRKQRSRKVKLADWVLSGPEHGKLFSEKYGKSATAKKGAKLSDQLRFMRKKRDVGEKVLDALLTPGMNTKTFTERPAKERRKIVALTAVVVAGVVGFMKINEFRG